MSTHRLRPQEVAKDTHLPREAGGWGLVMGLLLGGGMRDALSH